MYIKILNKQLCNVILFDDGLLTISNYGHQSYGILIYTFVSYTCISIILATNILFNKKLKLDLRLAVYNIKPNMETIVTIIQAQVSH
jgi:hypothetical protein